MRPAFSVILLTTLIGAGQGLLLALHSGQVGFRLGFLDSAGAPPLHTWGSIVALLLLVAGLAASFFHLGHPERAWRAASSWRTSWLSREVILLPAVMASIAVYAAVSLFAFDPAVMPASDAADLRLAVGTVAATLCLALFLCTGMIYACMRFLQEWATPLTVINFGLLGTASGFALATTMASVLAPDRILFYASSTIALTSLGLVGRAATLWRNAHLKRKSSLQTAIGVRHNQIRQMAQGAMGGSFNTREFFHGRHPQFLNGVKWLFLVLVFPLPVALIAIAAITATGPLLLLAALVQLGGLLAERWYFFADATHAQNLYYQAA